MSELLLVGVIFLAVGAPMLLVAVFLVVRTRRFLESAVDTTGTIVNLLESTDSDGGTTYQAVVRFETADGREIEWAETMASNPPAGQPGDEVPMKYDPANPENARIAKTFRIWFLPGLLGGLGAIFFVVGAILAIAGAVA